MRIQITKIFITAAAICSLLVNSTNACTGITLKSKDGAVVFGRTLEWGSFDLHSRLVIVPRGHEYKSELPDGKHGLTWKTSYGAVGIDAVDKDLLCDGMNEKGLCVGMSSTIPATPSIRSLRSSPVLQDDGLARCRASICSPPALPSKRCAPRSRRFSVVGVVEPAIGIAPPIHLIVTEPSGKAIVIEFTKGEVKIYDAPLGVITNSPNYDWHMTNLRNYVNLSAVAISDKKIEDLDFAPLGGGSGMIGLPGDFTPPSRFIRAVAFAKIGPSHRHRRRDDV